MSQAPTQSILDAYVTDAPSRAAGFEIFAGKWSSRIPGHGLGPVGLFWDKRIRWFEQQCGGFSGMRVLELGPLEGGHTYMLAQRGAASIKAIESNTVAFLKCLLVQNALKFDADFMLGDFRPYLAHTTDAYDLALASGVLYHMTEPETLLLDLAKVAPRICLWTQYYDAEIIGARPDLARKFNSEPRVVDVGGFQVRSHEQRYLESLEWGGFCGGTEPTSQWLTRESLIGLLEAMGYVVTIGEDQRDHPNGPAMLLYAVRKDVAPLP